MHVGNLGGLIPREERLKLEVFLDEAEILAPQAKIPVAEHGRFFMAASAGRTTRIMLRAFADKEASVGADLSHAVDFDEPHSAGKYPGGPSGDASTPCICEDGSWNEGVHR